MAANVASKDPPMALGCRQKLQQVYISLRVLPHEFVFMPSIGDILNKQQLCIYVNGILKKLANEFPTIDTPKPGAWKLSSSNNVEDLDKWNPYNLDVNTPLFISSSIESYLPSITSATTRHIGLWTWSYGIKSLELPARSAFLLQGDTHILLVLRCQIKVKVTNKKRRIDETNHDILVPVEYTISEILGLIHDSPISGVYQELYGENLRHDQRSVKELGWKNGTVLRLELW